MQNLKPSNLGRIKDGLSTLEVLEDKESCKLGTPTLDGGNSSNMKVKTLSTSKERSWMSKVEEMLKVTRFRSIREMVQRLRNGLLSM